MALHPITALRRVAVDAYCDVAKQIEAIEGFLELGMLREAGEEFEKIDPQHRTLVDVMVVQMATITPYVTTDLPDLDQTAGS